MSFFVLDSYRMLAYRCWRRSGSTQEISKGRITHDVKLHRERRGLSSAAAAGPQGCGRRVALVRIGWTAQRSPGGGRLGRGCGDSRGRSGTERDTLAGAAERRGLRVNLRALLRARPCTPDYPFARPGW